MTRSTATLITVIAGFFAIAGPILLSLYLAAQQAETREREHVLGFARDVVGRSDRAAEQFFTAFERLMQSAGEDPCSAGQVSKMREIDLGSSYLQAIGFATGNKLVCSSLGSGTAVQLELGLPDIITTTDTSVRTNVTFPFAQGIEFTVVERKGYTAIIHKDLPIDVSTSVPDISLATYTPDNLQTRSTRGDIKPEWLRIVGAGEEVSFIDDEFIVGIARSDKYATIGLAALPVRHMADSARSGAMILVPIGFLASVILVCVILYTVKIQQSMPSVLKVALKKKEFYLEYQPIVDLKTEQWVGAEALIRWRRPTGEQVRPDLFIPIAEECGLMPQLTAEVFRLFTADMAGIFSRFPHFHVGLNLSPQDIQSPEIVGLFEDLAQATHAKPGNIMLELTEHGLLQEEHVSEILIGLRSKGAAVAIDDFGTGYSSLSYLETFTLDYLKIDKSFVDKIGMHAAASQVVPHIIEMAKDLKLKMIAEGVETETQAQYLRSQGVEFAQGWLFGKPMDASSLVSYIGKTRSAAA
ncbi:EAL domain-containing protein [Roseibium sp. M-1]